MVPDVAAPADLPAAHAHALDRVSLQRPVHNIDIVNVLLDDMVAANPAEIIPAANLPFHVTHAVWFLAPQRAAAAVPVTLCGNDFADRPIVNPVDNLDVVPLMAPLCPGNN